MRLELKAKGPPRPEIALTQKCRSKTKAYSRAFKSEQYIKTPWLCGCEDSNKLFCFPYSGNKIPAAPQTRWNYNTRTVKAIHDNLEPLKECMQAIMDSHNSDPDSYNQAQSLLSYSNNENFLYWLNFHATLMPHCEMLFKFLQSRSLDSIKIMNEVSKFERAINELRDAVPPPSPKKKRRLDDVNRSEEKRKEVCEEIDELQEIRLMLLHKLQAEQRTKHTNKIALKLSRLWEMKKKHMEKRVSVIRYNRDRQLRKLKAMRAGQGDVADVTHKGHKRIQRHNIILYDPSLLSQIDHEKVAAPPAWLERCSQDLQRSCSGHHLPKDVHRLCERETKWNEKFLEKLHKDLIDSRLGAASKSAGPIRILKPRHVEATPRPATPTVDAVPEPTEACYQSALTLQRIIRGRAVQNLMYEGRRRSAELIEELKCTQGLDRPEKLRILQEDTRARDFYDKQSFDDQRESAISALVQDVCGGAVSTALDFLEKELVRLKEERKQHAFYLIACKAKMESWRP
ncbi:hypothetical protein EVAR_40759_1 [Eumeta japonica]|uniref:Uncharacterized protein n=1 Tax=Eumeta variegata TaxID=151549 RepID=A0A4C1X533_EUMVA|nr:hypothetical protein EVAR_40759_1 [Eumeta japonica]